MEMTALLQKSHRVQRFTVSATMHYLAMAYLLSYDALIKGHHSLKVDVKVFNTEGAKELMPARSTNCGIMKYSHKRI